MATKVKSPQLAIANYQGQMSGGNYTITTTVTDITGCSLTLVDAGTYLVCAQAQLDEASPGTGSPISVTLVVDGVPNAIGMSAFDNSSASPLGDLQIPVSGQWIVTTTGANKVVKLQVVKAFNTGTYSVTQTGTQILAIRIA